ncbi:uncharacterized protein LOC125230626 isoform X2 [Leguminivora glycinivorella]|uniref:uncharacterized protein LOC125230626 isoform X2 n=1 Tax=Leguminivora glycinivorella TaxID=1035111 RepID=UPI00200DA603|nr:uncharacterized protein LOC125230626 isoform X2 [Leguminivora glycinivorella]
MLKQVMNSNRPKFLVLFCIFYVSQLSQCKVAPRRNNDGGNATDLPNSPLAEAKGNQANSIGVEDDEANGPEEGPDVPEEGVSDGTKESNDVQPVDDSKEDDANDIEAEGTGQKNKLNDPDNPNGCWISLNEQSHFAKMSQLEKKYKEVRESYSKDVNTQKFDEQMLEALAQRRGIAERALQKFEGNPNVIPAGLNLGTYCMMRMPGSMLFFYRLKLRNNTRFTINFIHNDVEQLTLTMRLSLNDLHLLGQYERALTSKEDPSKLYYRPNNGEVEFLLKDVKYKVEGRYRLQNGKLHIEHILSDIPPMPILMRYTTDSPGQSTPLDPNTLKDYLNRMQTDLDHWLKDYFNDFLMLYGVDEVKHNEEIQKYENERTILLNGFADQVTDILNGRMREKGPSLMMPDFTLHAANGMEIRLYDGYVRGLDTMYRRSVTTGKQVGEVRYVDTDIGFSGLKTEYRYDTFVRTGIPPVSGVFVLNSEDVRAHMALQIVGYKPSVPDLQISFLRHGKPESLTIEGPANRIIANFKHFLEHHIISIMSSTLIHHIRSLSALTKCDPQLPVKDKEDGREKYVTPKEVTDYDDNDITTPFHPDDDDDEPTETPDNNDDRPTEPPDNTDDDTESPNNSDDVPTPDNNSEDEPTEQPDDQQTEPPDNNESSEEPEHPTDNDDKKPEYAFMRKESVELELPPKDGAEKGQSYKIDHNETFTLTKLNDNEVELHNGDVLANQGVADDANTPKKDNSSKKDKIVKLMGSDSSGSDSSSNSGPSSDSDSGQKS